MLVYPQMIQAQAAASSDYPAIRTSNPIAADLLWLARPNLFAKDSAQAEGQLFGQAFRNAAGLQVPNSSSGMSWPRPAGMIAALEAAQKFSIVWWGKISGFDTWANFLSIQHGDAAWSPDFEAFAFGRSVSSTQWRTSMMSSGGIRYNANLSGTSYGTTGGADQQYAVTWDGATLRYYRDAVLHRAVSFSIAWRVPGTGRIALCNRSSRDPGEGVISSDVKLAAIAKRAYSAAELASIRANPDQLHGAEAAPSDYPLLNPNNAIAQSTVWMAMPGRFAKDSHQNQINLVGGAARNSNGLQAASAGAGAWWPAPSLASINSSEAFTLVIVGRMMSAASGGDLLIITPASDPNNHILRFERNGETAHTHANWQLAGGTSNDDWSNDGMLSIVGDNQIHQLALSVTANRSVKWRNGVNLSIQNYSGQNIDLAHAAGRIYLCSSGGGAVQMSDVSLVLLCSRELTQVELQSIQSSPTQLIRNG